MSSVIIAGDTSGTVTLQAPAVAGTTTLTLPATSGTIALAGGSAFPTGTRLAFQQTAAPTGWTKDTTAAINDAILRLVTGSASSGGSLAFSTWAAQTADGATTLSTTQIPSHTHSLTAGTNQFGQPTRVRLDASQITPTTTDATGGGGSHTHSLSQSLKYYDFIIATAN